MRPPQIDFVTFRMWSLYLAGLAGIGYEAVTGLERAANLVVYVSMLGLPTILNKDEREKPRSLPETPAPEVDTRKAPV